MRGPQNKIGPSAIGRRMDALPFNWLHLLIFAVLGLGLMFDQMDSSMTSVLAAVFAEPDSQVNQEALSTMLIVYYIVAALGAPIMGYVADRTGRRLALVLVLLGLGVLTILAVLAPDFTTFALFRVASSFALAAVPPLVFSFIADTLPPRVRGVMMMLITILSALGAALAPAVTHWGNVARPFDLEGWEAAMMGAGAAGILFGSIVLLLPESPRWLSARNRHDEADRVMKKFERSRPLRRSGPGTPATVVPAAAIPAGVSATVEPAASETATIAGHAGRLALVVLIMFLQSCGLTGFALMLTKALIMKGMDMQEALAQSSLILLAMPAGVIAAAFIIDRMERRLLFLLMSIVLAISAVLFGVAEGDILLLSSGIVFSFFMTAHSATMQIYCAEAFPTAIRGTAMGFGYGAIRIGSACVPAVLLPLLLDNGPMAAFGAVGASLLAAGLVARLFGPAIQPRATLS